MIRCLFVADSFMILCPGVSSCEFSSVPLDQVGETAVACKKKKLEKQLSGYV